MFDELLETVQRRDYKLKYFWQKQCHCGRSLVMLLHRTNDDVREGKGNIYLWCGWDGNHLIRPFKKCSKCGNSYQQESSQCSQCENFVIKKTRAELSIEEAKLELRRLGKRLKQKRLSQVAYDQKSVLLNEKIEQANRELKNLS